MNDQRRQSLSAPRGPIRTSGDPAKCEALKTTFNTVKDTDWREDIHGFHSYPGRMHPAVPRVLLRTLSGEGLRVLDPFCGSGTTLVEAMAAGHQGIGTDIHPLAVRIARIKCSHWSEEELQRLLNILQVVGESALEKASTKAKTTSSRRPHPKERDWFQPHIRYELANLMEGLAEVEWSRAQDALEMILSSMLVKVSNRRSDSSGQIERKQLARGFTSRFFMRRGEELVEQLALFGQRLPEGARSPKIRVGDARTLEGVADGSVHVVVTSPPYPGTYDYLHHQTIRAGVLGIATGHADQGEIGSRRGAQRDPGRAAWQFRQDLGDCLAAMNNALVPDGQAILVLGNSTLGGREMSNHALVEELAGPTGFELVAMGSQEVHRQKPPGQKRAPLLREEQILWLQRVGTPRRPDPPRGRPSNRRR